MHRGFTENAELPVLDVLPDKFGERSLVNAARRGYTQYLVWCGLNLLYSPQELFLPPASILPWLIDEGC